jgi:hypothetical protein
MAEESDAVIDVMVRVWAGLAAILCAGRFVQAALSIIQRKPLPLALWWGPILGICALELAGVALDIPGPLTYILARWLP